MWKAVRLLIIENLVLVAGDWQNQPPQTQIIRVWIEKSQGEGSIEIILARAQTGTQQIMDETELFFVAITVFFLLFYASFSCRDKKNVPQHPQH